MLYAIIRLIPAAAAVIPVTRRTVVPPVRSAIESIYPRGNLTFAGVVLRRSPTVLVIRTRTEPEKMIALARILATWTVACLQHPRSWP